MQNNQVFFEQIEKLIEESISKKPSPIKEETLKISNRPNKTFFYNKNRIDVVQAWKEIEKIFEEKEEQVHIKKQEEIHEEHKVMEQKVQSLKTPQPKIIPESLETTKLKELQQECEKMQIDTSAKRKLIFDLD